MCGMMMGVMGAGLNIMGQVAAQQEKEAQVKEYNRQAAINARDAGIAASNKYADLDRKYIYDARANQQEGYKVAIKGLQAKGQTLASAGSTGFDVSSLSVGQILADEDNQVFQALDNNKTKFNDLTDALVSDKRSTETEAQGRINSMPYKAMPSSAGLFIGAASAALGGVKGMIN